MPNKTGNFYGISITNLRWAGVALALHAAIIIAATITFPNMSIALPSAPIEVSLIEAAQPKAMPKPAPVIVKTPIPVPAPVVPAPEVPAPVPVKTASISDDKPVTVETPSFTQPNFSAEYLHNPPPAYPVLSRRMGEEGKVLLRAYVLPDGQAEKIELKQSSGSDRLDAAALAAVRQWRFAPAKHGEEIVAAWVVIPISFHLEN